MYACVSLEDRAAGCVLATGSGRYKRVLSSLCSVGSDSNTVCRSMASNPMDRYAMPMAFLIVVACLLYHSNIARHVDSIEHPCLLQHSFIVFYIIVYV